MELEIGHKFSLEYNTEQETGHAGHDLLKKETRQNGVICLPTQDLIIVSTYSRNVTFLQSIRNVLVSTNEVIRHMGPLHLPIIPPKRMRGVRGCLVSQIHGRNEARSFSGPEWQGGVGKCAGRCQAVHSDCTQAHKPPTPHLHR